MVRLLVGLVIFAMLGWSGYWWAGSSAKDAALRAWLDGRQQAGWVADYQALEVQGFPNRFDTTISDLHLADPRSGWAWSAPHLYINNLSYQPNHIIVVWPQEQTISTPQETLTIKARNIRSSVKFEPNTSLALDRTVVIVEDLDIFSTANWTSTLTRATFTTQQSATEKFAHDVGFQAEKVKPARIFKAIVDPTNLLPDVFDVLRIRSTLAFDAPWDRLAVEGAKPYLKRLDLSDLTATWGQLDFQAKGSVELDRLGYPTGKIRIRAQNWKDMLKVAVSSGAVPQELASTLESVLGVIAKLSGNPDTIDAPLSFSNRTMSLGFFPIGPAPRFALN
ncbi:MAG: DUF2125 domain-containing protein [Rhodobacteraceae bacterium]|nr:DUF2125 domain-containing protein [Paracoccaceae bacterium]